MPNPNRENAHRLVYALWRHSDDLQALANLLDYVPGQLDIDIRALENYVAELEQGKSADDQSLIFWESMI